MPFSLYQNILLIRKPRVSPILKSVRPKSLIDNPHCHHRHPQPDMGILFFDWANADSVLTWRSQMDAKMASSAYRLYLLHGLTVIVLVNLFTLP